MISEKPAWIRHEGLQIFSIDIQSCGLRFATGGGDHKVRSFSSWRLFIQLNFDGSNSILVIAFPVEELEVRKKTKFFPLSNFCFT